MKKMIRLAAVLLMSLQLSAHEGMWLPHFLANLNYSDMKALGLKMSAEEMYSVNKSSLKDAIVSLGGFCTAEVISQEGLLLTNHHCGFDAIQTHSSVEKDYLKDGFWAMNRSEELPNQGLTATFLVRIEDVTEKINAVLTDEMSEEERAKKAAEIGKKLVATATEGTHYDGFVRSFFHENEYYLFVMETYKDVRLVGAPPSSVGKYGGDTDNWMWPRHTGDFSIFRIYSGPDGMPADYSADNIPMKPRHFLPVNLDGVEEGDFSMVFGFPGSTDRYLSSAGVNQAIDKYNPSVVRVRDLKLAIMRKYMDAEPKVRIQYASNYASTANYWKYYIGQTEQLKNNNVFDKKKKLEDQFDTWVKADARRTKKYGEVLNMFDQGYANTDPFIVSEVYNREAILLGPSMVLFGLRMGRSFDAWKSSADAVKEAKKEKDPEKIKAAEEKYKQMGERLRPALTSMTEEFFKDYHEPLEKDLMAQLFQLYADDIDKANQPEFIQKYNGKMQKLTKKIWKKSILASKEGLMEAIENPDFDKLENDIMIEISSEAYELYRNGGEGTQDAEEMLDKGYRLFTAGIREMLPNKKFSPDANSTMRVSYGQVGSYAPKDGLKYENFTTIEGIMQKEDPNNNEFVVPARLKELYEAKDYGPYTNSNGDLVVNFISNNDITGGNSGSPVINAYGELIGTAFDGNWEAMSGDVFFEDKLQRTISVDIRYTLFIIDKYAGAKHLIDEMTLVRRKM